MQSRTSVRMGVTTVTIGDAHVAEVRPVPEMDTPVGLFRGVCSCGWVSTGLETMSGAQRSAQQHADANSKIA